jgi:hypothetical protein
MIQTEPIPAAISNGEVPLIDFGDLDGDAMNDMIFYKDGSIYSFYNKYTANSASAANLCMTAQDGAYLYSNTIFSSFS